MKERQEDVRNDANKILADLLFEFSHATRLGLLKIISGKRMRHMEISKSLGISPQETTRHLERLLSSNLILKDMEAFFYPSPFGSLILRMMPTFEFIVGHKEYFLTHSLEEIPSEFVFRLHELGHVRFGKSPLDGLFLAKDMFSEAQEFMYVMSHHVMDASVPIVEEKVWEGITFKILLGRDGFERLGGMREVPHNNEMENLQFRIMERIGTTLLLNEKNALLCFPDVQGNPDYTYAFLGDDFDFHSFCHDLFFYFWDKAEF